MSSAVALAEPARVAVWSRFDTAWYAATYAADLIGVGATRAALELFYREQGQSLGHSPNPFFDERWYLAVNRDVADAVDAGDYASGFDHYCRYGHATHRPHWLFAPALYLEGNLDITADRIAQGGFTNAYDHYLAVGDSEDRSGHWLFDPGMHRLARLDAEADETEGGEFARFLQDGQDPGSTRRLSWYFDPVWYLRRYPEVATAVADGRFGSALEHYLTNAAPREYDPNAFFSEDFYAAFHVDVLPAIADGRFRNCFEHFLRYGAREHRKPHPLVELEAYGRSPQVQQDIARGLFRDAFAHYCSTGGESPGLADAALPDEAMAQALYARQCAALVPAIARRKLDFRGEDPAISVLVVACNRFAMTLAALASLRDNFAGVIQLILVDSGSHDEVADIERYVLGAEVIRFRSNLGYVEGCNAALARARAPATLYLNNDVLLGHGAIDAALARLAAEPKTGAVGGKVIRLHGRLQEAGCIVWRDGMTTGYLRDADPNVPEANFVRTVDFCSAVFLLCRTALLRELGGFDPEYSPAYFEEADLCLRMRARGSATVYDPAVVLHHHEFATTDRSISERLIARNLPIFRRKNAAQLRRRALNNARLTVQARAANPEQTRILFIEDRLPFREIGSGFTRSNDIVCAMAELGHHVTVFPIYKPTETVGAIARAFPETVEVIHDREMPDLAAFLAERSGYYHAVWIARTHNAERLRDILADAALHLPLDHMALDTEAVAAIRDIHRARTRGEAPVLGLREAAERELAPGFLCQRLVAVNELDAAVMRSVGFADIDILGHSQTPRPTPRGFAERRGVLFLGAVHDEQSPNYDSLVWFTRNVLPLLPEFLGEEVTFAIAGHLGRDVDLSPFAQHRGVELLGPVSDLAATYDRFRVLVAPTRFAGGIPYKLHEAAAYGLPMVASELLAQQVGWRNGDTLLAASTDDPAGFGAAVARLHGDEALWTGLRERALARIAAEHDPAAYRAQLGTILDALLA